MLRIYAIADLHGRERIISRVRQHVHECLPDALILAGDIFSGKNPATALRELAQIPVPILYVHGNADPGRIDRVCRQYPRMFLLNRQGITVNKVHFVGISGAVSLPFATRICIRELPLLEALAPHIRPHQTVMVAHPPPYGMLDEVFGRIHTGSKNLKIFLENNCPRLLICGHIHGKSGHRYLGDTLIVNCSAGQSGMGFILDLKENAAIDIMRPE